MLKELKLGFRLIKYGYKIKINVIMMILILAIGIGVEITSQGTSIIGGFYLMLIGMFSYQMVMSMDESPSILVWVVLLFAPLVPQILIAPKIILQIAFRD